jgi:hypothetical protein
MVAMCILKIRNLYIIALLGLRTISLSQYISSFTWMCKDILSPFL